MRMVLCWSDISGYMAASWRALAAVEDVELQIIAFEPAHSSFAADLIQGLNCQLLSPKQRDDAEYVRSLVVQSRPDVLYVSGWFHPPYRKLIYAKELASASKWIGVDTPWTGSLRQQIGRLALRSFINRVDRVFVAGERAWQYLRKLGAPESKISRGVYAVDYEGFSGTYAQRLEQTGGWPRRFLFTGRYAPEKGLEILTEGYAKYRQRVNDPWPLGCCGGGALKNLFLAQPGIEDFGFRQPSQLLTTMAQHGVFILASHFDPWPLVIVESASAGLPVICTEACGSSVELVRSYFNGIPVPTGDPDALAEAMVWMHQNHSSLPLMGQRGRQLAAAYSAQMWAIRWAEAARQSVRHDK